MVVDVSPSHQPPLYPLRFSSLEPIYISSLKVGSQVTSKPHTLLPTYTTLTAVNLKCSLNQQAGQVQYCNI